MRRIIPILLGILFLANLFVSYTAFGWGGVHSSLAVIIIFTLIFSCLFTLVVFALRLVRSLFRPELRTGLIEWMLSWFQRFLILFAFFLILVPLIFTLLIHGYNQWWPGVVTRYEVSNGQKTIVFQSMSHIASKEFYEEVRVDLKQKGQEGYVLFYEGVRAGTPENEQAFAEALGFSIDEEFYYAFQELTGLTFQGDVDFTGLATQDINVDLSIDEIMRIYEEYDFGPPDAQMTRDIGDMLDEIRTTFRELGPREKRAIQYGYRAAFNVLLRVADGGDLTLPSDQIPLFTVILDDRNAYIAKAIHESEYDNIYLMYGALHYEGILAELRRLQPEGQQDWEVTSVRQLQPIR